MLQPRKQVSQGLFLGAVGNRDRVEIDGRQPVEQDDSVRSAELNGDLGQRPIHERIIAAERTDLPRTGLAN